MQIRLKNGDTAPDFTVTSPWSSTEYTFVNRPQKNASVVFFLRYYGCLICQLDIKKIRDQIDIFNQNDLDVYVIIQSDTATIQSKTTETDWNFHIVCDPAASIYEKYGVMLGNIFQFLHPAGLPKVVKSLSVGHKHGKFEGEETQLPAVFRIGKDNKIQYAYYGQHISDLPDFQTIISKVS